MTHARLTLLAQAAARPEPLTFAEATVRFLRHCEAKGLSPATLTFYRQRLESIANLAGFNDPSASLGAGLEALTPDALRAHLARERERSSPATARHDWSALSAFCKFLVAEGDLTQNPLAQVARPKVPVAVVKPLTEAQVEALLAVGSPRTFCGTRLRAMLFVMVDCGLRAAEVVGLNEADVDWAEGVLTVRGKGSKERLVPFGQATRTALTAYLNRRGEIPGEPALFVSAYGVRLRRDGLYDLVTEAGEKAGVHGLHPHQLRHTCAVLFLRNGGDALHLQALLGHTSLDMTKRYVNLVSSDLKARHREASPGDMFAQAARAGAGRRRLR